MTFPRPGNPLQRTKAEYEVKDVVIENVDGYYIPIAGTHILKWYFSNAPTDSSKTVVKRKNIRLDPDFKADSTFEVDWPVGTTIHGIGLEQGKSFVWTQDGIRQKPKAALD